MIVLAAQALRLGFAALPLLLSVRGPLPSMPVERLVYRSTAVVSEILDLATCAATNRETNVETTVETSADATGADAGATGADAGGADPGGADPDSTATPVSGDDGAGSDRDSRRDADHHSELDSWDRDGDDDDRGRDEDSGGMKRSSTPDVSFGMNPVHVPAGEYHRRDMVCIGGDLTIDGEVRGNVVVVGGVLTISGTVRGDVVAVASKVHLRDTAQIRHNFVSVSGPVDRAPDARIHGEYHSIDLPNLGRFATGHGVFLYLFSLFLWIGVIITAFRFMAVLVVAAIAPARVEGALSAPRVSWILAFFLGFVVHLFAGIVGLILVIGIVTSPIGFALWLGVRVVVWMGLAAIYLEVGRNISRTAFKGQLSYFGSILLGFALFAVIGMIPFVGWFVSAIMSSTALGLMLLTRFGGRGRVVPAMAVPAPAGPSSPFAPPRPISTSGPAPESAR